MSTNVEVKIYIENCMQNKEYNKLVNKLIILNKTNNAYLDNSLSVCHRLIRLKQYSFASKLIYSMKKYDNDNDKINMMINLLNEEINYKSMPNNKRAGMKKNQKAIALAFEEKNYIEAANNIIIGKHLYNQNIYNYYLGKYYYRKADYKKAKEYLEIYNKNGYYKLQKSLFYLFKIEYFNNGNYIKYYKKYLKVISLNKYANSKAKETVHSMKKMIEFKKSQSNSNEDKDDYKNIENIIMSIEDFFEEPSVKIKKKKV